MKRFDSVPRLFGAALAVAGLGLLPLISGCGGSGDTSHAASTSTTQASTVSLSIVWPTQPKTSGAQPALIPLAAQSITVTLKSTTQSSAALITKTVNRPTSGNTTTITFSLPPGTFTVTATGYPNANGTGTALATGSGTLTTKAGQTATLAINMNSTIDHLVITPTTALAAVGGTKTLIATAVDATNAMVLLSPSKLTWKSSDASVATVSSTGVVTGVKTGSATIRVTDTESGKTVTAAITVVAATNGGGGGGSNAGMANSAWPKFQGNNGNTGQGVATGSLTKIVWSQDLIFDTDVFSSAAIGKDGTVYVEGSGVYAFNGTTGTLLWRSTVGNGTSSPAIAADGTVYVGAEDENLYAINGSDGTEKWQFKTNNYIVASPAVAADGTVYVGSYDNVFYAVSASGTLKWKFQTGAKITSSPTIGADGTVYFASEDGYLYALNGSTGSLKWKYQTGNTTDYTLSSSPSIAADGTVYIGTYRGFLYALDGSTGALKWKDNTGVFIVCTPAISKDGTVYVGGPTGSFGGGGGSLIAVNGTTGAVNWTVPIAYGFAAAPTVGSDGTVYVAGLSGVLAALDPKTGSIKATLNVNNGNRLLDSPVIGPDGTIYVGLSAGRGGEGGTFVAVH